MIFEYYLGFLISAMDGAGKLIRPIPGIPVAKIIKSTVLEAQKELDGPPQHM